MKQILTQGGYPAHNAEKHTSWLEGWKKKIKFPKINNNINIKITLEL